MKDFFELDEKTIKKIVEEIKDPVRQLMGDNVKDIIYLVHAPEEIMIKIQILILRFLQKLEERKMQHTEWGWQK